MRLHLVYCNNCDLDDVNAFCESTSKLVALRMPKFCFWPAKTRNKNLNFLRCIHVFELVLKYCSDINERNWSQLFFHFIVLTDIAASILGLSFLFCFSGFRLKFFRIAVSQKRLQLESDTDLTTTGFFPEFLLHYASYRPLNICMD